MTEFGSGLARVYLMLVVFAMAPINRRFATMRPCPTTFARILAKPVGRHGTELPTLPEEAKAWMHWVRGRTYVYALDLLFLGSPCCLAPPTLRVTRNPRIPFMT